MNLGIFLSPADSLNNMQKNGQTDRFIKQYLIPFSKQFSKVYLFSYEAENWKLPKNVIIVSNQTIQNRLIYGIFLPILHPVKIQDCDVIRGFGIASSISSFLLWKPFVFNWAYDYQQFMKVENKPQYIPLYFLLEKLAFWRANRVFVATKAKYSKLSRKKFIFLPNGVDMLLFKAQTKFNNRMLFIGRFEKQKNLQFMIKSLGFINQEEKQITMVGAGSLEKKLKKWSKQYQVKINLVKPMENKKLAAFMRNFSIFILTSYHEGSPKVLLEAMASGLIPVTTNFPTAKDIIEDGKNGFLTSFDETEYASAIDKVLNHKLLQRKISKAARLTITRHFDLDKLIQQEIRVLKNV